MPIKLDTLFFASHPDDVELTCGGTVLRLVKSGKKTGIIDLTKGELSTRGNTRLRAQEAEMAGKVLGIKIRENLNLRDGDITNTYTNRLKVIKIIRKYRPTVVFMPYHSDRHPDHTHTSILVKESSFYSGLAKIKTSLGGKKQEHHRPATLVYYMQTYTFEPTFIVDITNEFGRKMEAVKCYSSQFYDENSKEPETFISDKKFLEYLEARAAFYGFQIGVKYGEPFYMVEKLSVNPLDLLKEPS
jgi:bacillithiol biosynthesis deacetylase BshB1